MKCSCPKCFSNINIDEPSVPEKGSFSRCPECDSRFWLHRESFLSRAYRKDKEPICSHCGEKLGAASFCQSCYAPFPEYWVVQTSRPVRRKSIDKADFSFSLPQRKIKKVKLLTPLDAEIDEKVTPEKKSVLPIVILLLVVVGLVAGGMQFYSGYKRDSAFSFNYIKVLSGMKTGTDFSFKKLSDISSGKLLTEKEVSRFEMMKGKIDQYRQNLQPAPEHFVATSADLDGVYRVYVDLHTLTLATSGVSSEFHDNVESLKLRLDQAEQKLKNGLPVDLREDVKEVSEKYRNLQYLVQ